MQPLAFAREWGCKAQGGSGRGFAGYFSGGYVWMPCAAPGVKPQELRASCRVGLIDASQIGALRGIPAGMGYSKTACLVEIRGKAFPHKTS